MEDVVLLYLLDILNLSIYLTNEEWGVFESSFRSLGLTLDSLFVPDAGVTCRENHHVRSLIRATSIVFAHTHSLHFKLGGQVDLFLKEVLRQRKPCSR